MSQSPPVAPNAISLVDALERFNRKERNLLVRHILGHNGRRLQLSEQFRDDLTCKLKIKGTRVIPACAHWWTDYHISWIAGALGLLAIHYPPAQSDYSTASGEPWENRKLTSGRLLIESGGEDIDLVIAYQNELILIEVKGDNSFRNSQLKSKIERLKLARDVYAKLGGATSPINFHFALMSPKKPTKRLSVVWPSWALRGCQTPPWIELPLATDLLKVSRCNKEGISQKNEQYWAVYPTKEVVEETKEVVEE